MRIIDYSSIIIITGIKGSNNSTEYSYVTRNVTVTFSNAAFNSKVLVVDVIAWIVKLISAWQLSLSNNYFKDWKLFQFAKFSAISVPILR